VALALAVGFLEEITNEINSSEAAAESERLKVHYAAELTRYKLTFGTAHE
jgi:hypothetical protein